MFWRLAASSLVAVWTLAACAGGSSPPPPPIVPGPQLQPVPQLSDAQSQTPETLCLGPPGSGLRVFLSRDGHDRQIVAAVNVIGLPPENPWSCP